MLVAVASNTRSPVTLVDRARRELEERFVTQQLAPGTVWSEASLSELLGIGRTPVREAIARMAADGLCTVIRRAGIVISQIAIEDQLQVVETRRVLEKLVSLSAANRATEPERERFREMALRIERAGNTSDVRAYLSAHFEIKRFVAQCARNAYAERALRPLHTLSQRFYFAYYRELDNLPIVGRAHAELTRAIAAGDVDLTANRSDLVSDIAEKFTRDLLLRRTRQIA